MEQLIKKMMKWVEVSEALLKEKREILMPMGEALSWSYYRYVKENPITQWDNKTCILYGSHDNLTERSVVDDFVKRFHCELEVLEMESIFFIPQSNSKS